MLNLTIPSLGSVVEQGGSGHLTDPSTRNSDMPWFSHETTYGTQLLSTMRLPGSIWVLPWGNRDSLEIRHELKDPR